MAKEQRLAAPTLRSNPSAPTHGPTTPLDTQDGYAVQSSDGPGDYPVVGESRAGHLDQLPVTPGTVAYITTGRAPGAHHARGGLACASNTTCASIGPG